jgi:hypothetical protein
MKLALEILECYCIPPLTKIDVNMNEQKEQGEVDVRYIVGFAVAYWIWHS